MVKLGSGSEREIKDIYGTKMKPTIFRLNKKTLWNEFLAKLQWLFLLIDYMSMDKMIKTAANKGYTQLEFK